MKARTGKKVLIWIMGIITAPYILAVICAVLYSCAATMATDKYEPVIKYGEFPFKLTYSIDDEIKTVEDVIACEFDGNAYSAGGGQLRQWNASLKSGKPYLILEDLRDSNITDEDGDKILYIIFDYGDGAYYMGDKENGAQSLDLVYYISERRAEAGERRDRRGMVRTGGWYSADEAFEKFGIKLISFESAPPIENEFVKK